MSAVAINMCRVDPGNYQAKISAVDTSGNILYTTASFNIYSTGSIYSYRYYVDPKLATYSSYVISLYGSQGSQKWDSWQIPPIGSLSAIFPGAVGVVHITQGTSSYTVTYGSQLSDSSSLVTSTWSPTGKVTGIYNGVFYYNPIPNNYYPVSSGVLGIAVWNRTTASTQAPICAVLADLGVAYPSLSEGLYYYDTGTNVFSPLSVTISTGNGGTGTGTGTGGSQGNPILTGAAKRKQDSSNNNTLYWTLGIIGVILLLLVLACVGVYVYKKRS